MKSCHRPDIKAQQQCNEYAGDDNVTKTEHGKVVSCKSLLKQVLREHHCSTTHSGIRFIPVLVQIVLSKQLYKNSRKLII